RDCADGDEVSRLRHGLNRRLFLRWLWTGAAGGLAACRAAPTASPTAPAATAPDPTQPRPTPVPTITPSPNLQFDGDNSDVWTWETPVSGTLNAGLQCSG